MWTITRETIEHSGLPFEVTRDGTTWKATVQGQTIIAPTSAETTLGGREVLDAP